MFLKISLSIFLMISMLLAEQSREKEIISLAHQAANAIKRDSRSTLQKICAGKALYNNSNGLRIFVYNKDVVIVAHRKSSLIGKSFKGKTDIRGKKFRDALVKGAIEKGSGWVIYSSQKPGYKRVVEQSIYYKKSIGSDKKIYIIAVGKE